MQKYSYRIMLFKVLSIAVAVATGRFTGGELLDLLTGLGVALSSEEAQTLVTFVTVVLPAVYVGLMNRIKHTEWYQRWKARGKETAVTGAILALLALPGIVGCNTTLTPEQIDAILVTTDRVVDRVADVYERNREAEIRREALREEARQEFLRALLAGEYYKDSK